MHILKEHKLKYLNRRISDIEELKKCLMNNDFLTAANIGHRLKGNGETFGFPSISQLGIALENAALVKNREKISEAIEELKNIVEGNLTLVNEHI